MLKCIRAEHAVKTGEKKTLTLLYSRTPQDMDGTLTLIFGKSETTGNIQGSLLGYILYESWVAADFV